MSLVKSTYNYDDILNSDDRVIEVHKDDKDKIYGLDTIPMYDRKNAESVLKLLLWLHYDSDAPEGPDFILIIKSGLHYKFVAKYKYFISSEEIHALSINLSTHKSLMQSGKNNISLISDVGYMPHLSDEDLEKVPELKLKYEDIHGICVTMKSVQDSFINNKILNLNNFIYSIPPSNIDIKKDSHNNNNNNNNKKTRNKKNRTNIVGKKRRRIDGNSSIYDELTDSDEEYYNNPRFVSNISKAPPRKKRNSSSSSSIFNPIISLFSNK